MNEEVKSAADPVSTEDSEEQEAQDIMDEVSIEEPSLTVEEKELFQKMMDAGVFYGRSKSRTNPLMKKYVLTTRSGFEVLDLQSAIRELKAAADALGDAIKSGGTIVLVGTSPAVKNAIKSVAEKLGMPYVNERWLGGTFTNFETIIKRVKYFRKLKEDKVSGELEKYTKKEQMRMNKELTKLKRLFSGIENFEKLPAAVFIADLNENEFAAKEAKQKGISVVAMLNTDGNPKLVDYPIPANNRNRESVEIIMNYLEKVIADAKLEAAKSEAESKVGEVKATSGEKPVPSESADTEGKKTDK